MPGVQLLHETGSHLLAEGLLELDHQAATAGDLTQGCLVHTILISALDPGGGGVPAAFGVATHVGCTAVAGDSIGGGGRAVTILVDLEGAADEHVNGVVSGDLAISAVGTGRSIGADEEHVRPGLHIFLHAQLPPEAVDVLYPAAFNGGDECGVGIEGKGGADFAL